MAASTLIFVSYLVLFQMAENSTLISAGELPEWYLFDKNGLALAFFDKINVKNYPYCIRCWDLNSRPLKHESHPVTTRLGLFVPIPKISDPLRCSVEEGVRTTSRTT